MFCHVGLVGTWTLSVLAKNNTEEGSGWGLLLTYLQVWWEIKHATPNFQNHFRDFLATIVDFTICILYNEIIIQNVTGLRLLTLEL